MLLLLLLFSSQVFAAPSPALPWPGQGVPGNPGPQAVQTVPVAATIPTSPVASQPVATYAQPEPDNNMLQWILQSLFGTNRRVVTNAELDEGGADLANGYSSRTGRKLQVSTDGAMEKCGAVGSTVLAAFDEAKKFRDACADAQRGDNQKIVINDFAVTGQADVPYMYIFAQDGTCLGKTAVTYGNGLGQVFPQGCSDDGSHLTPPGFHLTGYHDGETYDHTNSLCMLGLEGQQSCARHVLIHPARSPGTASSFGCAGVGSLDEVKRTLGYGALVYNYFPKDRIARGCRSEKGIEHDGSQCRLENPERAVPATATGVGTPVTR